MENGRMGKATYWRRDSGLMGHDFDGWPVDGPTPMQIFM